MEWGLRAPITPRLGGNCWPLPRLGKIGAERKKNKPALNTKLRILPACRATALLCESRLE